MKIEKKNNNSYRIRKRYNGKVYSITLPYKPTQKEAMELMTEKLNSVGSHRSAHMTFTEAYLAYVNVKSNVMSPSTLRTYKTTFNAIPANFQEMLITDITEIDVQKVINDYSVNHAPKTTKNVYGFITAILGLYRPQLILHCKLPQQIKKEPYLPTESDIKAIFEYIKGSQFEIAIKLAAYGLRRSEICALTLDDLDGCTLTINKAIVLNQNKEWITKTTKTVESTRQIDISAELADLIREHGIYEGHPNSIGKYLNRVQDALGIPRFGIHKMRHFYASYSHSLGIPDKYIMEAGGWKTNTVLNQVYKHAMADKNREMQKIVSDKIAGLFS